MSEYAIQHHGILGQKWGVRRYQNSDGTLTEAGKKRYSFKERLDISNEQTKKENELRKKYLDESSDFEKYSKQANEYEQECSDRYGFRPGEDGMIWEYDDETYNEYAREPRTELEKRIVNKYLDLSDKVYEAAKIPNAKAREEAKKYIEDKYGNEVLKQIETDNNMVIGAAITASLVGVAVPFALLGLGVHGLKSLVG